MMQRFACRDIVLDQQPKIFEMPPFHKPMTHLDQLLAVLGMASGADALAGDAAEGERGRPDPHSEGGAGANAAGRAGLPFRTPWPTRAAATPARRSGRGEVRCELFGAGVHGWPAQGRP
ncbi:MAG: hypothetical protein KIS90_03500 [Phenylobacterium sp.]|nr:hypothetical protein [Phenylobacterium sp.]